MIKGKNQCYKQWKLLVEGVSRAERIKAAAQKVSTTKVCQLSIRTHNFQRFNNSANVAASRCPSKMQR